MASVIVFVYFLGERSASEIKSRQLFLHMSQGSIDYLAAQYNKYFV